MIPLLGFFHLMTIDLLSPSKEDKMGAAKPNGDSTAPISELLDAGPGLVLPYKSNAGTDLVPLVPNVLVPLLIKSEEGSNVYKVESLNIFFEIT